MKRNMCCLLPTCGTLNEDECSGFKKNTEKESPWTQYCVWQESNKCLNKRLWKKAEIIKS